MDRLKDENASLKEKVAKGPMAMPEFANAGEAEKRAAELMTRNAVVEEELKNYQKYMKTNMVRYQKEIAGLKKECSFWKKKAVEAGVPPNAYGG